MNPSKYIEYSIKFVLIILSQILIFKGLVIFDFAFCFAYIGFILFLPANIPFFALMSFAFVLGLTNDIFYDTAGIHAAASVFIAFIRPHYMGIITPRGGYDNNVEISMSELGFPWITLYLFPLLILHHLLLFSLEAFTLSGFGITFLKTLSSSFYTFFIIVIYLRLTEKNSR